MHDSNRERTPFEPAELSALLDNARHAIIIRDLEGRVVYWNKGAERIYGWTAAEALARSAEEMGARKELLVQYERAREEVIKRGEWSGELREPTKGGGEIVVESYWRLARDAEGRPASIHTICSDITERKELEDRLLRTQRLESLGLLAAGIAHDLSNVLSPILMVIEALRTRLTDEEGQYLLALLRLNTSRGADLVDQILSFARGTGGARARVRLEYLVGEIAWVLKRVLPKSIQVTLSLQDDLWQVEGDVTQLYQVLMNLCLNARDAMPDGGCIIIGAENVYRDGGADKARHPFVLISVADNGAGIPSEILEKVFDPFFTTKGREERTGLGLPTARRIVEGHGGFIEVTSVVSTGTEFRVYLPATLSNEDGVAREEHPTLHTGNGETILLVDDEMVLREFTRRMLEDFGYRVLAASDGGEAVSLYSASRDIIKAVVTNIMMPGMNGIELIESLRAINPQVAIVAVTGLSPIDPLMQSLDKASVNMILTKPYTAESLLGSLAKVLKENK